MATPLSQHPPQLPLSETNAPVAEPAAPPATLAALMIDTAVRLGVTTWVISPGSRSAPLTAALAQRDDITRYVIYDERSAGYVALGLAQQLRAPVGLVCTSGTAALNYGPAVAEAFYQAIPLLVLTADRPPEWIDQQDNQAIHQNGLYGAHVRASFTLPVDDGHPDTRWHAVRTVADALQMATSATPGPTHINVHLREPLYAAARAPIVRPQRLATAAQTAPQLAAAEWDSVRTAMAAARSVLVVGGPQPPDARLHAALASLGDEHPLVVIGDITANLWPAAGAIQQWDALLSMHDAPALHPELVISFGGPVTSRGLKALLRTHAPQEFWRVGPGLPAPDTFQTLNRVLPLHPADFFASLANKLQANPGQRDDMQAARTDYANQWRGHARATSAALGAALDELPFGEFAAMRAIFGAMPKGTLLQLGNSMPIRYANLLALSRDHLPSATYANRGVSGIDGCVSTAVGAALASPHALTLLLVGDLSFFYDRNGLWHRHLPPNLRIVLLNNHGGGIFDIIDGPQTLPDDLRHDYFLTPQSLKAQRTAEDYGLRYFSADNAGALTESLPRFFAPANSAAILEIESDMALNTSTFRAVRARIAQL